MTVVAVSAWALPRPPRLQVAQLVESEVRKQQQGAAVEAGMDVTGSAAGASHRSSSRAGQRRHARQQGAGGPAAGDAGASPRPVVFVSAGRQVEGELHPLLPPPPPLPLLLAHARAASGRHASETDAAAGAAAATCSAGSLGQLSAEGTDLGMRQDGSNVVLVWSGTSAGVDEAGHTGMLQLGGISSPLSASAGSLSIDDEAVAAPRGAITGEGDEEGELDSGDGGEEEEEEEDGLDQGPHMGLGYHSQAHGNHG